MPTVFERLEQKLRQAGIAFVVTHHAPVFTSEQAAAIRGVSLASGAKALVVKGGDTFALLVLPADRKLDSKKARAALSTQSRFATKEELLALTGLEPGAVPPFGSLFGLATYADFRLADNESIHFNAGDHSISVQLRYADWLQVEAPRGVDLTS